MEAPYYQHPLVRPGALELRSYQRAIVDSCLKQNTLVILPTGLGKTSIALMLACEFMSSSKLGFLMLAPTRVLVNQHYRFFRDRLLVDDDQIVVITGEDHPADRYMRWDRRLVFATPQVTRSDLRRGICDLSRFSLLIFDEAHRAVGDYPYTTLAERLLAANSLCRIVGLTASPPSDEAALRQLLQWLRITRVEMRDEQSPDVVPYIHGSRLELIEVELPPVMEKARQLIAEALGSRLNLLRDSGLLKAGAEPSVRSLLDLRAKIKQVGDSRVRAAYYSCIRLLHAANLLGTQTLSSFVQFFDAKYQGSKRERGLMLDSRVSAAYEIARGLRELGHEHPKLKTLEGSLKKGERSMIFASYRSSVERICSFLNEAGFKAGYLIGKSGVGGQDQVQQSRAVNNLREGIWEVLVATQVGEEGLDIAECNTVVFFDSVPSAVRFVQRRGRTGRTSPGRVLALITKGTRDETYYWLSRRRLKEVGRSVERILADASLQQYL